MLMIRSAHKITARGGQAVSFTVGVKNTGGVEWVKRGVRLVAVNGADPSSVRHVSWTRDDTPVLVEGAAIKPGQIGYLDFMMNTPGRRGDYSLSLALLANDAMIPEAMLEIPVTVTDDALVSTAPGASIVPVIAPPSIDRLGGVEPMVRVGLYYSELSREEIVSDGPYEARNADGALLASFQPGNSVQFWYDASSGAYRLTNGLIEMSSTSALRFVNLNSGSVFTLLSHLDRPAWNQSLNDNRFRGTIEMKRHAGSGRVWIINELLMDSYLKGLTETSNASPLEFQKALAVAARTYAVWHKLNPGKYDDFTVGALNDQVYKGYGAEIRLPRFTEAVDTTRGQIATWNGDVAITPYFTWSDGRTRSWKEVWGGAERPWLVSIPATYDAGRVLNGHGVGLSAWDAIGRANSGETYDKILKYYYTGTELRQGY
jgi:hypothetical protein